MKKFVVGLSLVLVLAVFAVPAVSAQASASQPVQIVAQDTQPPAEGGNVALPVELEDLVKIVIGLLVAQGLKSLSNLLGKDISGWAAVITASLASGVIFFFNALLSTVPELARPSVAVGLTFLVTILATFGLKDTLKAFQSRAAAKSY